jgi:hypothetical protein
MKIIDDLEYENRRTEIFDLVRECKKNLLESFNLNKILVKHSTNIITSLGRPCKVNSLISDRRTYKLGYCFINSTIKMKEDGWGCVEGFTINKQNGEKISHSWNIDKNGSHLDLTFRDSQNYEYVGIEIPWELISEIGYKNGGVWYCNLPFLTP